MFDRHSAVWTLLLALAAIGIAMPALAPARAFEAKNVSPGQAVGPDLAPFVITEKTSPAEAYEFAKRAFGAGRAGDGLAALEFAADSGYARAQWELAQRYAKGDGVKQSDRKAFEYYRMLADQHADADPRNPDARLVSGSFVELARYYVSGIPDAGIGQNISRAFDLLSHAATYFGDADAQYQLGKMYLEGRGVIRSPVIAAKWLMLSARKQYTAAQAELGMLLYSGGDGLKAQPKKGLMFLEIARRKADPQHQSWIIESFDKIFSRAEEEERQSAINGADQWVQDFDPARPAAASRR
jgi:hypothetical protein